MEEAVFEGVDDFLGVCEGDISDGIVSGFDDSEWNDVRSPLAPNFCTDLVLGGHLGS